MNTNKPGLPAYTGPNKGWALWVHHEQMLEYCTDFAGRIAYIRREKPRHEQATRLAALTYLTPDEIPPALDTARAAYHTAWAAYDTAWAAYDIALAAYHTARAALDTAWAAAQPLVLSLCERYCPGLYHEGALRFPKEDRS